MTEPDQTLKGFRVLVCVSASISAYKSVYLVRLLRKLGAFVSVAVTPSATRFVGSATFSALASEPTFDDLWDERGAIAHTNLGRLSDLIVVYPATASTIAKISTGLADDIVTAALLCAPKSTPVVVVPAMHEEMYDNASTQENIETLRRRAIKLIGPDVGELAGGDQGRGRLVDPELVVQQIVDELKDCKPKASQLGELNLSQANKISSIDSPPVMLITAGGTREPIDTVRVIANRSTGKMGHSLSRAASSMGYSVILITTSDLKSDEGVKRIQVETSDEMYEEVMSHLGQSDVVIMAAAVSDFKPNQVSSQKLKRRAGLDSIDLIPAVDILEAIVSKKNGHTLVVGFAAESENVLSNAKEKFVAKGLDLLIANDVSRNDSGFGSETNKVWIFDDVNASPLELDSQPKQALAFEIVELIEQKRKEF